MLEFNFKDINESFGISYFSKKDFNDNFIDPDELKKYESIEIDTKNKISILIKKFKHRVSILKNIKFSNEVNDNIPSLEKEKNKIVGTIKNKKFIGIKRTGNFIGIHNKYSSDNLFRKVKSFLLMNLTLIFSEISTS